MLDKTKLASPVQLCSLPSGRTVTLIGMTFLDEIYKVKGTLS